MFFFHLDGICLLRKRAGFNVGRFDINVGQEHGAPKSHDFLGSAGFLSCAQCGHACVCGYVHKCMSCISSLGC